MDMGEVVKLVHVRIYAYAREKSKLEDNIGKILADIESKGYKAAVFLGETEDEWKSLLLPYRKQEMLPHGRQGQGIPAETLGLGHPFNFSALIDDGGL